MMLVFPVKKKECMEFFMIKQNYKRIYVISSDCFSLSKKKKKDDVMMLVFPVKKKRMYGIFYDQPNL